MLIGCGKKSSNSTAESEEFEKILPTPMVKGNVKYMEKIVYKYSRF